ncbi:hypothetical protein WICPIJ_001259 [Wickerhamomyces pijperi]|uniref:DNA-directed RNA polymerase III subunit RPC5 n=1 Tax=Wickerhamomyces pijperi TaxID=599730 RepID=A0A9P8QDY9_WICPI|nr:hypothetical protein WICPIJ_001259 [Wickerhamomyces pijperi]
MSLFVQDEDDQISSEPTLSTTYEQTDEDMPDVQEESIEEKKDNEDELDPVVQSIPIHLKPVIINQELNILQYPGRPAQREYNNIVTSQIKPKSKVIAISTQIDTTKFYDEQYKYNTDLSNLIKTQVHEGNLINTPGTYIGSVQDNKLVLAPLDNVAQLRPALNYIDKDVAQKKQMQQLDARQSQGTGPVQVVQMTVKSSSDTAPRLGGALLSRKIADDEDFVNYKWLGKASTAERSLFDLTETEQEKILLTKGTKKEYVDLLVKETASV